MTQEEKDTILSSRASLLDFISHYTRTPKDADALSIATPARDYLDAIHSDPDAHCTTELAAVKRFYTHLNRPDVHFDTKAYTDICKVHSRVPQDSETGRRCFAPTPCQCFQYASIYGLTLEDDTRLYQTACICIPRKYAKSSQVGIMAINEFFHGPANGQVVFCANSEKQATVTFNLFKSQLDTLDPDGNVFKTQKTRAVFNPQYARRTDTQAFAVATNASSLDGLHASVVICDEFSQATSTDTRQVLTTSMKGRRNPLTIIITTLSDNLNGPFYTEFSNYMDILLEKRAEKYTKHPTFIHIFTPDPDDDLESPVTWRKVHPHYGITVQEDDYIHDLQEADTLGGTAKVAFYTKMLNTWCTESGTEWISYKKINESTEAFTLDDLSKVNLQYSIGVDLSDTNDFTSVSVLGYSAKTHKHYFYTEYFFPHGRLDKHPNSALYKRWADSGYLTLIDADFIDQTFIANRIIQIADKLKPASIYYDQYHAGEVKNVLSSYGYTDILKCCKQLNSNTHMLIQYLEKIIHTHKAVFSGNPIDAFCFSNVRLESDNHDNKRMDKRGSNTGSTNPNKIDGAVTCMMTCQAFFDSVFSA